MFVREQISIPELIRELRGLERRTSRKDAAQPIGLRMDAAKVAIGYEKPRLAAVDGTVEGRMTLEQLVEAKTAAHAKTAAQE